MLYTQYLPSAASIAATRCRRKHIHVGLDHCFYTSRTIALSGERTLYFIFSRPARYALVGVRFGSHFPKQILIWVRMFDVTCRITSKIVPNWHRDLVPVGERSLVVLDGISVDVKDFVKAKQIPFHRRRNLQYYDLALGATAILRFLWLARHLTNPPRLHFEGQFAKAPEIQNDTALTVEGTSVKEAHLFFLVTAVLTCHLCSWFREGVLHFCTSILCENTSLSTRSVFGLHGRRLYRDIVVHPEIWYFIETEV